MLYISNYVESINRCSIYNNIFYWIRQILTKFKTKKARVYVKSLPFHLQSIRKLPRVHSWIRRTITQPSQTRSTRHSPKNIQLSKMIQYNPRDNYSKCWKAGYILSIVHKLPGCWLNPFVWSLFWIIIFIRFLLSALLPI